MLSNLCICVCSFHSVHVVYVCVFMFVSIGYVLMNLYFFEFVYFQGCLVQYRISPLSIIISRDYLSIVFLEAYARLSSSAALFAIKPYSFLAFGNMHSDSCV